MFNRRTSQILFTYGVVTALVLTGIILFSLIAQWSWTESIWLTMGVLVVVWAILFSILETRRIASRSESITGPKDLVDPDGPRTLIVEPPTGDPVTHHEFHPGSPGLDQGQLTSRLPDQIPFLGRLQGVARSKKQAI